MTVFTGHPTAVTPTARQRWRRWRFPLAVTTVVVLFAVVLTILQDQTSRGYLDPDGVNISGARALVRLLEDQGVTVTPVRTTDDAVAQTERGDTLVVTEPDRLLPTQVDRITGTGADLVLVAPTQIERFDPGLELVDEAAEQVLSPACAHPVAERAGEALLGGRTYRGPDEATGCYPAGDGASFIESTAADGGTLIAVGSSAPMTNRYLDQDGNAALVLGILGRNAELTWYRPSHETPPEAQRDIVDLMPGWVGPAVWQLAIAVGIAAWWRGRRLGPVVTEPLPVVVRAAEATEGRGRLYARGHARAHAATILRDASLRRLRARLSIPTGVSADAVVEAVSSRTGRDTASVSQLLHGPAPGDDADLVRLANSLDELEQEVIAS